MFSSLIKKLFGRVTKSTFPPKENLSALQYTLRVGHDGTGMLTFDANNEWRWTWINSEGNLHSVNDEPAVITPTRLLWCNNGTISRTVGPASIKTQDPVIRLDCSYADVYEIQSNVTPSTVQSRVWAYNGTEHRVDGPAIDGYGGDQYWYQHGKLHNVGHPAVIADNRTEYHLYGVLHREDGPAIIATDDYGNIIQQSWFFYGIRHCPNGPAVITPGGSDYYWFGKLLPKESHDKLARWFFGSRQGE